MKVLFLDVDGVLNSDTTVEQWEGYMYVDKKKIARLQSILKKTGAEIVLSSTWRTRATMQEGLRQAGLRWCSQTPNLEGYDSRGAEVALWLTEHPEVERYVILDDIGNGFMDDQRPYFVQTDPAVGLTEKDAKRVISLLGKKE